MRSSLATLIAATAIVLLAGPADAASRKFCTDYVASVVEGIKVNREQTCGFPETERYLDNPGAHMNWCLGASEAAVREEIGKRTRQVNLCRSCRVYASEARENSHRNAMWGCGSSGPQWSEDENGHFQWCYAAQIDAHGSDLNAIALFIKREALHRKNRIAACTGEDAAQCRTYADKAVHQGRLRREFKCFPEVSEDWDFHFGFCRMKMATARNTGFVYQTPQRVLQAKQELTQETVNREAGSRGCLLLGACLTYADNAIKLVNEYPGCTGFRWSRSWQDHLNWCGGNFHENLAKTGHNILAVDASLEDMKAQEAARNEELRTCGRSIVQPRGKDKKVLQTFAPPARPGGGISRVNPNTSPDKSGSSAMDRLGGGAVAPAAGGGSNTAKPGATVPQARPGAAGSVAPAGTGPSGGFNTAKPDTGPLVPTLVLPPPRSKSGM